MTVQIASIETSPQTLAKASAGAAVAAALVLTLFVLPAEKGIDITGLGGAIGLTRMAAAAEPEAPVSEAPAVAPGIPAKANIVKAGALRNDAMTVILPPHSGTEVKAHMRAGDSFVFRWDVKGGLVKVDMHGERPNAADGEFTSYWKEKELGSAQGSFTAPFDGTHGWYWRNKGDRPVTVTVHTNGFYKDLFRPEEG
ncbi:hypothetical protein [Rhizorhapis sp. SPR117]|uniref:hypothetical protein n=1 Tax=Rhizorhapis sp. SPR117 TaxID=2912611 RepID=UPI001F408140|nr:hypothetical protein [Rhizorhapis sp. SPR117]